MMKRALCILLASTSLMVFGSTAYAQTTDPVVSNPDTTQTDRSEEDWRKSKKKSDTDDILDIFKNPNSTGVGNSPTYKPIDALPETSRRHLMRERAKRMAEAGVGEPIPTNYEPSEAAKSDPNLKADEQAAWDDIIKDMNGGANSDTDAGTSGSGQSPDAQAGQQGTGQQGAGQGGSSGQGGQSSGDQSSGDQGSGASQTSTQPRSPSAMRGGSATSVSDILSQIKGRGMAKTGVSSGPGQGSDAVKAATQTGGQERGESPTGTAPEGDNNAQSQSQDQSQGLSQEQGSDQGQSDSTSATDSAAQAASKAAAEAQAQAQAQAEAAAQDAKSTRTPEPMSPLDRLKQSRENGDTSGSRSSASDFLKKKD